MIEAIFLGLLAFLLMWKEYCKEQQRFKQVHRFNQKMKRGEKITKDDIDRATGKKK